MYQNVADRCLTGEVRLSYAALTEPKMPKGGGEPKFSTALLIPKTDAATVNDLNAAVQYAYERGVRDLWKGARPQMLHPLLKDGDGVKSTGEPYGEEAHGCYVLNCSCKRQPPVVHQSNIQVQLAPSDIYSGMYARVTLEFYPYDANGNRGVACGLRAVMKTRDGEPFGGAVSAENDFAGLEQALPQPVQPAAYPAQPTAYTGQPAAMYPVPPAAYPAQPTAYSGQPFNVPQVDPITGLPL